MWALNIEGMARNFRGIAKMIQQCQPHVVLMSETWAKEEEMPLFGIKGYEQSGAGVRPNEGKGRNSGGMMEFTRQHSPWMLELENVGREGDRIRIVKMKGMEGKGNRVWR